MKKYLRLPQLIFVFLFLFQLLFHYGKKQVVALDANTDREALMSFKRAISDPQNALSGWNHTSSHCTWLGVSCTIDENRVRSLRLPHLGLSGTLSPHLANLTSLRKLDLTNNSFYGHIPSEFGRLSLLKHLILQDNLINGTIPATLSRCYRLREIILPFNKLIGNLPSELGNLPKLKIFDACLNNLTGVIPPTFGNLSSLTELRLERNQILGAIPKELGRLSNLSTLNVAENQLTSEIPSSIYNISSLVSLSLAANNLVGKLPNDMLLMLPNLKSLYLDHNRLQGLIPTSLSNASQFQVFDLSSNGFQGPIPSVNNMIGLTYLNLANNSLSSNSELNHRFIESLTNSTHLQDLRLNSNQLAGELPYSLANLSIHLKNIFINDNHFTGSFPKGLEKFRNLFAICIEGNFFSGEVLNSISVLHKLQKLSLHENMFSGEIPNIFGNLTQLSWLTMGFNNYSGTIPPTIGGCPQLNTLGLAGNKLNGSIPQEIFGLHGLSKLILAQNALHGFLASEVGSMKQLEIMDVSSNHLSGSLPEEIGGCLSMREFIIARNNITGSIPRSIEKLAAVENLDLSSNALSGPIPEELENLSFLRKLNLSFNDLEGQVPRNGVFTRLRWDSFQGNPKLCSKEQVLSERLRVLTCTEKKSGTHLLFKIMIPVVCSIVFICAIFCLIWTLIFKKKEKGNEGISSPPPPKGSLPKISYSDIQLATNNFAAENLIGKGGFGSVYKGAFGTNDGGVCTTLAVKVIDLHQHKALKSFTAECEALRNVRHRNLVKVISSCSSIDHSGGEFKALVMDFMSNGNLDEWLYQNDTESGRYLSLTQRIDIATDVASALDYLHHDCLPPIVHCDLKPGNVLLDDNMGAHVGDFGLARFLSPNSQQKESSTIGLKGSIGYIAPEYGLGSKVWPRGDVYSFGILLLEMFTAKKPSNEMFNEGLDLKKFASAVEENQVLGIADARLFKNNNECSENSTTSTNSSCGDSSSSRQSNHISKWQSRSEECLASLMGVGLSCAADSAGDRLTMREALARLHAIKKILLGQ